MTKKARSKTQKRVEAELSNHPLRANPLKKEKPKKEKKEEFSVQWDAIQQLEKNVDAQQVDEITDHLFRSVLSRFGWTRDEQGRLEKTGAEETGAKEAA